MPQNEAESLRHDLMFLRCEYQRNAVLFGELNVRESMKIP